MGFLEVGEPLEWQDTDEYYAVLDYVIKHGTLQFLEIFNKVKDRTNDTLKWGDEVEYHIFSYRSKSKGEDKDQSRDSVSLSLVAKDLLQMLTNEDSKSNNPTKATWHPEWGAWMIESTPAAPFGSHSHDLIDLQKSLRYRRMRIISALNKLNQNSGDRKFGVLGLPVWPRMGCEGFVQCEKYDSEKSHSIYLPDEIINPHPRFGTLVQNIRKRRGRKVEIHLPVFKDKFTNIAKLNADLGDLLAQENYGEKELLKAREEIYMDGMGFGMGCCCLQVTFQARDLKESRYLYDQLAVLCPIFLSLSAGSAIFKGILADTDCRWDVISQSVDCRTEYESNNEEKSASRRGKMKIRKSRYSTIDLYISDSPLLTEKINFYNDTNAEINQETFDTLKQNGVDEVLARHVAHLFTRDPLVVFGDRIKVDDKKTTEHFENIQSTNWQNMRWKPPPSDSPIGWRVEFRPMEIQLTDFENAAFTVCIVLLSRVILFFNLNLYIPISKVDENMATAMKRNSVLESKFWFRKNLVPLETKCNPEVDDTTDQQKRNPNPDEFVQMTIAEILNGKGENFPGLFPLIYAYMDIIDCPEDTYDAIEIYLTFLKHRSEGKIKTLAKWVRDFVTTHPDYKHDSLVSEIIERDLVKRASDIGNGFVHDESLLGGNTVKPIETDNIHKEIEPVMGMPLRGASFIDDVGRDKEKKYNCQLILDLIEKYRNSEYIITETKSFQETPAYLN